MQVTGVVSFFRSVEPERLPWSSFYVARRTANIVQSNSQQQPQKQQQQQQRVATRLTEHGHHGVDGLRADVVVDVELTPPRLPGEEGAVGDGGAADVRCYVVRCRESLQKKKR